MFSAPKTDNLGHVHSTRGYFPVASTAATESVQFASSRASTATRDLFSPAWNPPISSHFSGPKGTEAQPTAWGVVQQSNSSQTSKAPTFTSGVGQQSNQTPKLLETRPITTVFGPKSATSGAPLKASGNLRWWGVSVPAVTPGTNPFAPTQPQTLQWGGVGAAASKTNPFAPTQQEHKQWDCGAAAVSAAFGPTQTAPQNGVLNAAPSNPFTRAQAEQLNWGSIAAASSTPTSKHAQEELQKQRSSFAPFGTNPPPNSSGFRFDPTSAVSAVAPQVTPLLSHRGTSTFQWTTVAKEKSPSSTLPMTATLPLTAPTVQSTNLGGWFNGGKGKEDLQHNASKFTFTWNASANPKSDPVGTTESPPPAPLTGSNWSWLTKTRADEQPTTQNSIPPAASLSVTAPAQALVAKPDVDPYGTGSFGAGLVEKTVREALEASPLIDPVQRLTTPPAAGSPLRSLVTTPMRVNATETRSTVFVRRMTLSPIRQQRRVTIPSRSWKVAASPARRVFVTRAAGDRGATLSDLCRRVPPREAGGDRTSELCRPYEFRFKSPLLSKPASENQR